MLADFKKLVKHSERPPRAISTYRVNKFSQTRGEVKAYEREPLIRLAFGRYYGHVSGEVLINRSNAMRIEGLCP